METEILYRGKKAGTLSLKRQGLYMVFLAELSVQVLSKLYVSFEAGVCSLGVPVPHGTGMFLRASIPASRLPGGQLIKAELHELDEDWEPFGGGTVGGVFLPEGFRRGNLFRFPWEPDMPLPADEYLCFYQPVVEKGRLYLQLRLTETGQPVMNYNE